jgi:hypothetical protein
MRSHEERKLSGWGSATSRSSLGDTILSWHVVDRGKLLGWGFVKWPADDNNDDAEAHAAELLAIAEASPAQRWPKMQVLSSLTGLSRRLEPWFRIADSIRVIAVLVLLSTPPSSANETASP